MKPNSGQILRNLDLCVVCPSINFVRIISSICACVYCVLVCTVCVCVHNNMC